MTSSSIDQVIDNASILSTSTNKPQIIETHISVVLLVDDYAYKLKKAVDFGFLNFTALDQRKHYCEEEVRLNSRMAPKLYLGVVAFINDNGTLRCVDPEQLDKNSQVVEYAVKMRRFEQNKLFSNQFIKSTISMDTIKEIAQVIASFHTDLPAITHGSLGTSAAVNIPVVQNFEQILPLLPSKAWEASINTLQRWSEEQYSLLESCLDLRKQQGFIKECHGDLHLGNITEYNGSIQIFDGIEFNDEFRFIDTINDLAFLVMDLYHRQQDGLANQLINEYLDITGDYEGLKLLRFYLVYRALVRAKISLFRYQQLTDEDEKNACEDEFSGYVKLAEKLTEPTIARLCLMRGVSGSGKSWLSQQLLTEQHLLRVRSDKERLRIHSGDENRYSPEVSAMTYQRLLAITEICLDANWPVIVDATFLKEAHVDPFKKLAVEKQAPFNVIHVTASETTLVQRIESRLTEKNDISEATVSVMQDQLKELETLAPEYNEVLINTDNNVDIKAVGNF